MLFRSEPPVRREDYMFDTGYVDRGGVANQYRQGATVILPRSEERRVGNEGRSRWSPLLVKNWVYLIYLNKQM